jgi:hypothetical protein
MAMIGGGGRVVVRRTHLRAATSVAASLGIVGIGLVAAGPVFGVTADADPSASASPSGSASEVTITATVTQTTTVTPEPTPQVTKTITVTPKPRPTVTVTVTKTHTPPPVTRTATAPAQNLPVLPTTLAGVPTTTPTSDPAAVSLAPATPSLTPTPTAAVTFEEPTPESVPIEIRNATPEFDQVTVSRKLSILAAGLVLLALLAWLVFEGRLRRMAHAAAVRKAGPRASRGQAGQGVPTSAGPVYPQVVYVPVQGYPADGQSQAIVYGYPYSYSPVAPAQEAPVVAVQQTPAQQTLAQQAPAAQEAPTVPVRQKVAKRLSRWGRRRAAKG